MSRVLRKKLRANSTLAERAMWRILWPFRTNGFHFRKQVEIGPYYVDFACRQAGLIIEVDGETHFHGVTQVNDQTRDEYLTARGFKALRFSNEQVLKHAEGVFDLVASALDYDLNNVPVSPPPHPSPQGGGCRIEGAEGKEDKK